LISFGVQEEDHRVDAFAALLAKPIKSSQLYNVLMEVFAGEPGKRPIPHRALPEVSGFDQEMGKRLPLRILLAEDNAINQQLAILTLERLGYRADVAGNGLEVLDALELHSYDVILMDVQMPEMDGIEATHHIRQEFSAKTQPRIIAMTANAMHGDREQCLAAGMDDYISKPFEVQELVEALRKCQTEVGRGYAPADAQTQDRLRSDQETTILDPVAIKHLQATLGEQAAVMLPVLIETFFSDAVKLQEDARQAFEQHQTDTLRRAAHTLKSNAKNFGATALAQLCQELETCAKVGELQHVEELLLQIATEYPKVKTALGSLQKNH
jgi:CheY-like chemotaxis protein